MYFTADWRNKSNRKLLRHTTKKGLLKIVKKWEEKGYECICPIHPDVIESGNKLENVFVTVVQKKKESE